MRIRGHNGFTLLEVMIAMGMSAGLIACVLAFYAPALTSFKEVTDADRIRGQVLSAVDTIGDDISEGRAAYVDNTKCYVLCVAVGAGNRSVYYWFEDQLFRKRELAAGNAITCAGGQLIGQDLTSAETAFAATRDTLKLDIGSTGTNSNVFRMTTLFSPRVREREVPFSEDFECQTLNQGWTKADGLRSGWGLVDAVQGDGRYEIADTMSSPGTDTSTIEMALDLSRFSTAQLSFRYMSQGTIDLTDSLKAEFHDGASWQTVLLQAGPSALTQTAVADLSAYGLNNGNKIRFTGTLTNNGAQWLVDDIEVTSP